MITAQLFGEQIASIFDWVHKELDSSARFSGPTHRRDPVHSEGWIALRCQAYYRGFNIEGMNFDQYQTIAVGVAKLHIETDKMPISNKDDQAAQYFISQSLYGTPVPPRFQNQYQRPQYYQQQQYRQVNDFMRQANFAMKNINRLARAFRKGW